MVSLTLFVHVGGSWDDSNIYCGYSVCGVIVPDDCTYTELIRLIAIQLEKPPENHKYMLCYQEIDGGPRVQLSNDYSVIFYLEIKKGEVDRRRYPLCVDVCELASKPAYHLLNLNTDLDTEVTRSVSLDVLSTDVSDPFTMEIEPAMPTIEEMGNELSEYIVLENGDKLESSSMVLSRPSTDDVAVGSVFKNKDILITMVSLFAIKNSFEFRVVKSDYRSYALQCVDKNCDWTFRASRTGSVGNFKIRRMVDIHKCSVGMVLGDHRQASSLVIANCIKNKFVTARRNYTLADVIEDMQESYGVTISYDKAWRSRELAIQMIRGYPAESYGNLPSYLYMTKIANPGSYTRIEVDNENRFMSCFVALGASIAGWTHCKPVIVVDGTFLTSRYRGTLFTACTQDANNNIFILAFGVGDTENNNAWEWFMLRLREAYGEREGLCIVSDRHGSIQHAVEKVFPNALHGACTYHLLKNLRSTLGKKGKGVRIPFNAAARAYTETNFEKYMGRLDAIDEGIRGYLKKAGYERWSRAHMTIDRYSTMTSNIVESVNSAIKHAKKYPIEAMFECLRSTIQKWFFKNLSDAKSTFTRLASRHNSMLNERVKLSMTMRVFPSSDVVYQVNDGTTPYVVNMEEKTCTCRRFQLDHLPCPHAIAVISKRNYSLHDYCSTYFSKENYLAAYQGTIYPLGNKEDWYVPDDVRKMIVLPPESKRGPGRPKESRFKSSTEYKKTSRCRMCDNYGHNSRTFRNPVPSTTNSKRKRKRCQLSENETSKI